MQIKLLVFYKVGPSKIELPYLELPAFLSEKSFPLDFPLDFSTRKLTNDLFAREHQL